MVSGFYALPSAGASEYHTPREGCGNMPLPLLPILAGALLGKATAKKPKKRIAVNGRMKKDGTRGKAYTRRARSE